MEYEGINYLQFIVGERCQLETNATGNSTETQELEAFATSIGTSLSPPVDVNHNGN